MEWTAEQQASIDQLVVDAKTSWETEVLAPLTTERDSLLQYKPATKSDAEKAIEQRENDLWKKEIRIILKEHQMDDFADLIKASNGDELKRTIESVKKILDARKLNGSYVPNDHKQTNAYDQAAAKNDVNGMIGAKLAKLFN